MCCWWWEVVKPSNDGAALSIPGALRTHRAATPPPSTPPQPRPPPPSPPKFCHTSVAAPVSGSRLEPRTAISLYLSSYLFLCPSSPSECCVRPLLRRSICLSLWSICLSVCLSMCLSACGPKRGVEAAMAAPASLAWACPLGGAFCALAVGAGACVQLGRCGCIMTRRVGLVCKTFLNETPKHL